MAVGHVADSYAHDKRFSVQVQTETAFGTDPGSWALAHILPTLSFDVGKLGRRILYLEEAKSEFWQERIVKAGKEPMDITLRTHAWGYAGAIPTADPAGNTLSQLICSVMGGGAVSRYGATQPLTPVSITDSGSFKATDDGANKFDVGGFIAAYKADNTYERSLLYSRVDDTVNDDYLAYPHFSNNTYDTIYGVINFWLRMKKTIATNLLAGKSLVFFASWDDTNGKHGCKLLGCRGANMKINYNFGALVEIEFSFSCQAAEYVDPSIVDSIGVFGDTAADVPYPLAVGDEGFDYLWLAKEDVGEITPIAAATMVPIVSASLDLGGKTTPVMGWGKTAGVLDFQQDDYDPKLSVAFPAGGKYDVGTAAVPAVKTLSEIYDEGHNMRVIISSSAGYQPGSGFDMALKNCEMDGEIEPGEVNNQKVENAVLRPTKVSTDVDTDASAVAYGLNDTSPLDQVLIIAQS